MGNVPKVIYYFRDGYDMSKFLEAEYSYCLEWSKKNGIEVKPIMLIKRHIMKTIDGKKLAGLYHL